MYRFLKPLRLVLLVLAFACAMFAQRDLSTLAGTITDPSGGVVANAKVTITEIATGQVYAIPDQQLGRICSARLEAIRLYSQRERARIPDGRTERHAADGR